MVLKLGGKKSCEPRDGLVELASFWEVKVFGDKFHRAKEVIWRHFVKHKMFCTCCSSGRQLELSFCPVLSVLKSIYPLVSTLCVCVCSQFCPTLCNSMDCSPPGSSVHEIFQARILKWVAISYSGISSQPRDQTCISCVSCIGRQILYHWAAWGAQVLTEHLLNEWMIEWIDTNYLHIGLVNCGPGGEGHSEDEDNGLGNDERELTDTRPCMQAQSLSCLWLFGTPWTVAHRAPLSMGFSRQQYWSGLPFPSLGDLPHSGIQPMSVASPALAGQFFTTSATWETLCKTQVH